VQAPNHSANSVRKVLGPIRMKLRATLASVVVLGVGAWLAPETDSSAVAPPQERAAPLLDEQVARRETAPVFTGVQDAAQRIDRQGLVVVQPAAASPRWSDFAAASDPRSPGFGIFVSSNHVLTHYDAVNGRSSVLLSTAEGRTIHAVPVVFEPATGLMLLETDDPAGLVASPGSFQPETGDVVLGSGSLPFGELTVPTFVMGVAADEFVASSTELLMPGMPVYSLEGELMGIAGRKGSGQVHSVRAAATRLRGRLGAGGLPGSAGMEFQAIEGALASLFGTRGLLVTWVVPRGAAARAGIEPGDVLLTINGAAIADPDGAVDLLHGTVPGASVSLEVMRNNQVERVAITSIPAHEVIALAEEAAAGPPSAPEAGSVLPEDFLEVAGITSGARVIRINGQPAGTRLQAARALRRQKPVLLLLERGGSHEFVAVP